MLPSLTDVSPFAPSRINVVTPADNLTFTLEGQPQASALCRQTGISPCWTGDKPRPEARRGPMPRRQGSQEPVPAATTRGITVRPPVLVTMTFSEWEEAIRLVALIAPDDQAEPGSAA